MDYDDAEVDASDSSQALDLTDVGFLYDGEEYELADVESGASVYLSYGRVVGFEFVTDEVGNNPELEVVADDSTITIDDGEDEHPFDVAIHNHDAPELDTSESTTGSAFQFTLANGTVVRGEFVMDSEDVPVPDPEVPGVPVNVAVTDFTLRVGSVTYTESDCASTPTASFDANGNFTALNYSIQNITGQAYTQITSSNNLVTISYASAQPDKKTPVWEERQSLLNFATVTTGQAYSIWIRVYAPGGTDGIKLADKTIHVVVGDGTSAITTKVQKELKKAGIFAPDGPSSSQLWIGGSETAGQFNEGKRPLSRIEIVLFTERGEQNVPIPNNNLTGPAYAEAYGTPKPTVKVNGTTLTPP